MQLGALVALPEDPGSILSTHTAVHTAHIWCKAHTQAKQNDSTAVEPKILVGEMWKAAHTTLSLHPQAQYGAWPVACIKEASK